MANKSEIGWKRETAEGEELQVFARHTGGKWIFFCRTRRYERWERMEKPTLEDWLLLLDAVKRRIQRRLFEPDEVKRIKQAILRDYPEADID